jgi:hypothetical protein
MELRRMNDLVETKYPQKLDSMGQARQDDAPKPQGDSVSIGANETKPKKWTIMHYTAADNNLTEFMVHDVNEMEVIGSTENMNLVIQLDKGGSDCKRYYLTQDSDLNKINSPMLQDMGSTNMADPKVLTDFIVFAQKNYPAENFALILSDHGGGWPGAISDDSHGGWMTTPDIRKSIDDAIAQTGKKIDVLGFDACLMASTEVAYEMKDNAKFLVASEQTEGGAGWAYTPLLTKRSLENLDRAMREKLNIPPDEFAKKIVTMAQGAQGDLPTMSATDLSKMKDVADATNLFAGQIILTDTPNDVFKKIANNTQSFYGFKDIFHFADQVAKSKDITDEKLKKAAAGMTSAIKGAVIAEEHSSRYPNAHGLTSEIPTYGGPEAKYLDLRYAQNTLWDEAMGKMNK